jgi:hypothetical protein
VKKIVHQFTALRVVRLLTLVGIVVVTVGTISAQTYSPWEMNLGEGIVSFDSQSPQIGHPSDFDYASIPPPNDPNWGPAPNPYIIGYSQIPSTLCDVIACRWGGDFTYFRTFVNIPSNVVVTEFRLITWGVDDGLRVTIFNSSYPEGIVVPGSYVYGGLNGTTNLSNLVVSGEFNTVIITHVDDCCYESYLNYTVIVLNGEIIPIANVVDLDIKPWSDPNSINCYNDDGIIPLAILTTENFDATTVDHTTVKFGPSKAMEIHYRRGEPSRHEEDIDGDGDIDLVLHFRFGETGIQCGDTDATLMGETYSGVEIFGSDAIRTIDEGGGPMTGGVGYSTPTFILFQNTPNPFSKLTTISYQLRDPSYTTLKIFNLTGNLVTTLVDGEMSSGIHTLEWKGDVASGIYFYRLTAGDFTATRKLVVLK